MDWARQIHIKTPAELEIMREAGRINATVHATVRELLKPGVTTADLNAAAEEVLRKHNAVSPFKNYPGPYPYPASITVCINEELVHGIPSKKRKLKTGDIVSVDCGTILNGYVADSAFTAGVGVISTRARKLMEQLYRPFVRQGNPIFFMDERSAEVTKYAANSYLATRISFMNEIANLCELVGANVDNVRRGMGADGRIGKRFLFAGIGYGGSCFPKDVKALAKTADDFGYDFKILKSVMAVNQKQKMRLGDKIKDFYKGNLAGKVIGVWGLSFKPNTDDIREAPALEAIDQLLALGATIQAYDPEAMDNVKAIYGDKVSLVSSKYDAIKGANCLAIMTEWNEFRTPDFGELNQQLTDKAIFDGRNLYDLEVLREAGLTYMSIGRMAVHNEVEKLVD